MKIKMVKKGWNMDNSLNPRIRGIIPTEDEKYVLIEIHKAYRPDEKYFNMSKNEYNKKFPNEEYVSVMDCYRIDNPKEYYDYFSKDYKHFESDRFYEIPYNKDGVIKLLQMINKNIDDIEITDKDYIDEFKEEKGFFKLYDDRLKHNYIPLKIDWSDLKAEGQTKIEVLYTCYSAGGEKFEEKLMLEKDTLEIFKQFGKESLNNIFDEYVNERSEKSFYPKAKEHLSNLKKELFEEIQVENVAEAEDDMEM